MANVTVYGTDKCEDTRRVRELLDQQGVNYDYINVDEDKEAEEQVIRWNGGEMRKTPILVMKHDGTESMVIAPTKRELQAELDRLNLNAA